MGRDKHTRAYSFQAPGDKQTHNQRQADTFNSKTEVFTAPLPEEIKQARACHLTSMTFLPSSHDNISPVQDMSLCLQRLARIVDAVPDLGPDSRIMDVGSGTGCLIPFFRNRGVQDILAVDLSANMLAKVSSSADSTDMLPWVAYSRPNACVLSQFANVLPHAVSALVSRASKLCSHHCSAFVDTNSACRLQPAWDYKASSR